MTMNFFFKILKKNDLGLLRALLIQYAIFDGEMT